MVSPAKNAASKPSRSAQGLTVLLSSLGIAKSATAGLLAEVDVALVEAGVEPDPGRA
jgi:hypothetical protein